MKQIFNKYYKNILNKSKVSLYPDEFNVFLIINSFILENKTIFLLFPNINIAAKYYEKISKIMLENTLFYPLDDQMTLYTSLVSGGFLYERLNTLNKLLFTNKNYIVIGTYDSLLMYQYECSYLKKYYYNLKKGETYPFRKLKEDLTEMGYRKKFLCENPGEITFKGSIIDVFPYNSKNPIRLDFFDNTLEKIKEFDANTQLSVKELTEFMIPLNTEIIYSDSKKEDLVKKINNYFKDKKITKEENDKITSDIKNLITRENLHSLLIYSGILIDKKDIIFNYPKSSQIFVFEKKEYDKREILKYEEKVFLKEALKGDSITSLKYQYDSSYLNRCNYIEFEKDLEKDQEINELIFSGLNSFLDKLNRDYKDYFIYTKITNNENKKILENKIKEKQIKNIKILDSDFSFDFIDNKNKLILIKEDTLFNLDKSSVPFRNYGVSTTKVKDHNEISYNDYVVHYDYGISRYKGLVSQDITGIKRDYLLLEFAGFEKMYVPVEQIDLILKYHKDKLQDVKLSKLGTKSWENNKRKAKDKIKKTYYELKKLYEVRNKTKGYSFFPNNDFEKLLKDSFPYKETLDQEKAIKDVFSDMKKDTPMERLICGDVGFGKTEVAIRAAFRAVLNNKQVAVLSPTTILATQHYETFKKRLSKFGVNIALLNRFVSKKDTKEIIQKLSIGEIDILIGTHRIIQDDIKFFNIGLYIIDEEQRFGVVAKEKIRSLHIGVDTIFLSATPIPRTLKMGLGGLKDLSIIATPPENRYPIQTYLLKRNPFIIRDAILKELTRGGQVFYLVSRINEIGKVKKMLENLVPDLKIGQITGRMEKYELGDNLDKFINGKLDLLITTTIIENGIDIPNANTIIVHDSQMFGLAQLYQIKGRVGRGNKIAYCYFCYEDYNILTSDSKKRLNALKEHTALGSGYKIAMQDMLIRGSGELLGKEQSGFIDTLGYELYLKLLEEEINPESINKIKHQRQPYYGTHIKTDYIEYEKLRIEIHKKVNNIKNEDDLLNLENELLDRFGKFDLELSLYLQENLYKVYSDKLKITKTEPRKGGVKLSFDLNDNKNLIYSKLLDEILMLRLHPDFKIIDKNLIVNINFKDDNRNFLYVLNELFLNYFKTKIEDKTKIK